jgi:hypothetical protein
VGVGGFGYGTLVAGKIQIENFGIGHGQILLSGGMLP